MVTIKKYDSNRSYIHVDDSINILTNNLKLKIIIIECFSFQKIKIGFIITCWPSLEKFWSHSRASPIAAELPREKINLVKKINFPLCLSCWKSETMTVAQEPKFASKKNFNF